ncbi:MAG: sugar isomerase domain-containing protein [Monoglobaceae bacterium]
MTADIYFEKIVSILAEIRETQREKMIKAAECAANVIKNDGIIYIFGCGHSHLIALDCFYRSGGLANVSAMLDTDLMLHNGAAKSSKMEKMHDIAENIFERYCISENDMIFVISTSGKNAVPVEMAQAARKNNVRCVSVVSSEYFNDIILLISFIPSVVCGN